MRNNIEFLINEVVKESSATSKSQTGDTSQFLLEQGFFENNEIPFGLKNRDKLPSGKNPIDVKKDFEEQN